MNYKEFIWKPLLFIVAFVFLLVDPLLVAAIDPFTQYDLNQIYKGQDYRSTLVVPYGNSCAAGFNSASSNGVFYIGDSLSLGLADAGILDITKEAGYSVDTNVIPGDTGRSGGEGARRTGKSIEALGGFNTTLVQNKLAEDTARLSSGDVGIFVVGLGTNDYGAERKSQYRNMINFLHDLNSTAQILWVNTKFYHPEVAAFTDINADINTVAAEYSFVHVLDYATATEDKDLPPMAPPTSGTDQIHLSPDKYRNKAQWIVDRLPNSSNRSGFTNASASTDTSTLTTEEKIAQTFFIGFNASQKDTILEAVKKYKFGGVYVLGRGSANDNLNSGYFESLNQAAGIPLLVASDEEGGGFEGKRVQRFADQIGEYAGGRVLADMSNEEIVISAQEMGTKLKERGINVVFAPVVDVEYPGTSGYSSTDRYRIISSDPNVVAVKASAFMQGLKSAGVSPTLKHFPGLGSGVNTDFNENEDNGVSLDSLKQKDLIPYESLITNTGEIVMLNSSKVPGLTAESGEVVGTSSAAVNLLRNDYGFSGIITTDDLTGAAVKEVGDLKTAIVKALQAGVTMPLFTYPGDAEMQEIIDAVVAAGISVDNNLNTLSTKKSNLGSFGGATCGGVSTLSGNENSEMVWNYMRDRGLSDIQASGFMGNMQAEASFEPRRTEYAYSDPPHLSDTVPDCTNEKCQPGYGIVQWTAAGRKQNLRNHAAQTQYAQYEFPEAELIVQLDFVWVEIQGGCCELKSSFESQYGKVTVLEALTQTTDVAEATRIITYNYEIPSNIEETYKERTAFACEWLAKYGTTKDIGTCGE